MRSNSGFLALQSMIAAAIVGIMLTVLMGVLGNISTFNEKYRVKEEMDMTIQKVRAVLQREETCLAAIEGTSGPLTFDGSGPLAIPAITLSTARGPIRIIGSNEVPRYEVNGAERPALFSVGPITLSEIAAGSGRSSETVTEVAPPPGLPSPVYQTFLVNLTVPILLRNAPFRTQTIALKIYADPTRSNQIVKCFSTGIDNRTCGGFGGTMDAASGRCNLPPCDATVAADLAAQTPPRGRACSGKANCAGPPAPQFYWVFQGPVATANDGTLPWCVCVESCR